jgi:hypothetical protein
MSNRAAPHERLQQRLKLAGGDVRSSFQIGYTGEAEPRRSRFAAEHRVEQAREHFLKRLRKERDEALRLSKNVSVLRRLASVLRLPALSRTGSESIADSASFSSLGSVNLPDQLGQRLRSRVGEVAKY